MHGSDGYNSEDELGSSQNTAPPTSGVANGVTSGVQLQDIFARLKAQASAGLESDPKSAQLDENDMDDLKSEAEASQHDVLMAMQRHALQMATAAAAGSPFANLAALRGFGDLNAMSLFANGFGGGPAGGGGTAGSNLSPPMGSVASQSASNQMTPTAANNSGMTLSTLEAGKGYTFEEQFKQASHAFYTFSCSFFIFSFFSLNKYFMLAYKPFLSSLFLLSHAQSPTFCGCF